MTTRNVVADDMLGQIAKKQWELFRRVKEGSLEAGVVLNSLQAIIENQVEKLDIEKVDWTISSMVHEVTVEEAADFVSRVKQLGYAWDYNHPQSSQFILQGDPKSRKKKSRFRLAKLKNETSRGVIKVYADLAGYDLATAWELLSFVRQSAIMRVMKARTNIIALGDYGRTHWSDSSTDSIANVNVCDYPDGHTWNFNTHSNEKTEQALDMRGVGEYYYILLRERTTNK